jgi:hypothetical protein
MEKCEDVRCHGSIQLQFKKVLHHPIKTHADVVYPSEAADGKLRIRIGKGMIR